MSKSFRGLSVAASAAVLLLAIGPAAYADQGNDHSSSSQGKHLGQTKAHSVRNNGTHHKNPHAGTGGQAPAHAHGAGAHAAGANLGSSASHAAGANGPGVKDAAGDPPGNNGTVKISLLGDTDGPPNNVPHPGCGFEVQWYGYDAGSDVISTVRFSPQAPTGDVTIAVNGPTSVAVGGDSASGAGTSTGLDAVEDYTLTFSGGAPAKQGYHVRVTVSTPRSLGNDTKTKVFWVEPCDTTGSTGGSGNPAPGTSTGHPGPGVTSGGNAITGLVQGAAVTSGAPATTTSGVPTAIDAGAARHGVAAWVHSPWPLVVAGFGALLAALGLARMRRRA